jgi:hypothetical protein
VLTSYLHNATCDNSKSYATIKCAKQGAILTAIGTGTLTIGRFRIQAFICRNHELQHSSLGLNPLTARGCTAEFTNRYFRLNHTACLQPILVGYKYNRPTLWRVTIPPPQQDTIAIPRTIADDPFLAHFHDDTTTTSLKCDEILDHLGPSSAPDPITQTTPLYGYRDFSYASSNNATIGTYKVPLVHNLKRPPPTKQRVLPSKKQRALDLLVQQTQPIKRRKSSGSNTTTLRAYKRVNTPDINTNNRHQPTARLTWGDVSGPVLNLKIDGDQSFQTNAEKWAQSETTEINSLNQSGAFSPVYDGPVQSEVHESSRHINIRFHALRTKADFEADFLTKPLPTPLYEQLRRDMDANENYSN